MTLSRFNALINKVENLARDSERFFTNKYQRYRNPTGFRIELYAARKFNLICGKLVCLKFTNLKVISIVSEQEKDKGSTTHFWPTRHPEKKFCPYGEKTVAPMRLHKLDFADIIIDLLTAGLWVIFLFVMYLFIGRCPVCNYNLRGFKFLSDKKKR